MPRHARTKQTAGILLSAAFALTFLAAKASNSPATIEEKPIAADAPQGFTTFAHLPSSTDRIVIVAEDANVHVQRKAGVVDVSVSSSCPHDWNLTNATIRQAGFVKPRGGVQMKADALGSRAVVNGHIYPLPENMHGGLSLNKEGVSIGGQPVKPLAGVDMPGTCEASADELTIMLPENFQGELMLAVGDGSHVDLNNIEGGKVECTLVGDASLSADKLNSLTKAVVDVRGKGHAEIGYLQTKVLVANVSGPGTLTVKGGGADMSNATVSQNGSITLKGKYRNLKQAVDGQGNIKISD